ncbi:helix-turn-helix domain-containing protein [Echinicola rosea]|nr:helix-turn-helix domain-containing protein [Echinicola rosea]
MEVNIITKEDLDQLKFDLIEELSVLLDNRRSHSQKRYVKSREAKKILQVSSGTLQNMRLNGDLPFTKIGGVIYYDTQDIQEMMEANKQ